MTVAYLMVTCCLEPTKAWVLSEVLNNLEEQAPGLRHTLTVFDNSSTHPGVVDELCRRYDNVVRSNRNVGYWTAVDWWLQSLASSPPEYIYIIEGDVVHYAFGRISEAIHYLDRNPDVGSVRLHEYSVHDMHLYNKDVPRPDSRRNIWQSHTNKVTGDGIWLRPDPTGTRVWLSNFLTHLPALNRYGATVKAFEQLRRRPVFSELDFQRAYWESFQATGVLDGGIYHNDLNGWGTGGVTGSWTNPTELARLGYLPTRVASIVPPDGYTVTRL